MNPRLLRALLPAAVSLAWAAAPARAQKASLPGSICVLDVPGAAPAPAASQTPRDAAGSALAFSQGAIDLFNLAAPDPLTEQAVRDETRRAISPQKEPPHWRSLSAAPSRHVQAASIPAPAPIPIPTPPLTQRVGGSSSGSEPGDPADADGVHDGSPRTVAADAFGRTLLGLTKSPSAYESLGRMAGRVRRAALTEPQHAGYRLERVWDATGHADALPAVDAP